MDEEVNINPQRTHEQRKYGVYWSSHLVALVKKVKQVKFKLLIAGVCTFKLKVYVSVCLTKLTYILSLSGWIIWILLLSVSLCLCIADDVNCNVGNDPCMQSTKTFSKFGQPCMFTEWLLSLGRLPDCSAPFGMIHIHFTECLLLFSKVSQSSLGICISHLMYLTRLWSERHYERLGDTSRQTFEKIKQESHINCRQTFALKLNWQTLLEQAEALWVLSKKKKRPNKYWNLKYFIHVALV